MNNMKFLFGLMVLFVCQLALAADSELKDYCAPDVLYKKYELLLDNDQQLRSEYQVRQNEPDFPAILRQQDKLNQNTLDEFVNRCGWPDSEIYMNSPLEAAFLVIQHAPHSYQKKYYANLSNSYKAGKIPEKIYARRSQKPSATPICCKVLQCQETMSI